MNTILQIFLLLYGAVKSNGQTHKILPETGSPHS